MRAIVHFIALGSVACGTPANGAPIDAASESAVDAGYDGTCIFPTTAYDDSCTTDTDCTVLLTNDFCNGTCFDGQPSNDYPQAISVAGMQKLRADTANVPPPKGPFPCMSTGNPGPCCRAGKCRVGDGCSAPSDTLPACADAGGTCKPPTFATSGQYVLTGESKCASPGPASTCAYADETCCLGP